jgi:hypothetical protein
VSDATAENARQIADAGVDQVIFLQQVGRNKHEHICHSLELFGAELMPEFKAAEAARLAAKEAKLAPHIEAALARKKWMQPLADEDVPVVNASVSRAQTSGSATQSRRRPRTARQSPIEHRRSR